MVPERNVDPADLYDDERRAFVAFLESRSAADLAVTVAATPAWSVRDVLAHVVGITADLNAQHFGDVHAALGLSPTRDDESIAVALDFYLASFEATLDDAVVGLVSRYPMPRQSLGEAGMDST